MPRPAVYSQEYINSCFNEWYLHGRPSNPGSIRRILPEHETGRLPSVMQIKRWMVAGAWDIRADELDVKVAEKNDIMLINAKAKMLREQLKLVEKVTKKSYDYLMVDGFDSSSAATKAFFDGLQEQRKIEGFSDLLERLDKMTNNDVEKAIIDMLNRAADNDQIIDSDAENIPQLEDKSGDENDLQ